jgi:hypothetical protein
VPRPGNVAGGGASLFFGGFFHANDNCEDGDEPDDEENSFDAHDEQFSG